MRRSSFTLTLAFILLACCSPQALGANTPQVVTPDPVAFGPVLTKNSVVYGTLPEDANSSQRGARIWRGAPGSPPSLIARFEDNGFATFAASDQAFAGAFAEIGDCGGGEGEPEILCTDGVEIRTALRGLPARLDRKACLPAQYDYNYESFTQPLVAVLGSVIAIPVGKRSICGADSRVRVFDLKDPAKSVEVPGRARSLRGIAMAGKYVATVSISGARSRTLYFTLFDRRAKRVVSKRSFPVIDYQFAGLDVQADGTVALSAQFRGLKGNCARGQSIQIFKTIGRSRCMDFRADTEEVQLADSKLMAYEKSGGETARLVLVDLSNGSKRVIRKTADAWREQFDFDGRRVAWTELGCLHNSVAVIELGPELATFQPRCPVDVPPGTISLDAQESFSLQVTCPSGCSGNWDIAGPKSLIRANGTSWIDFAEGRYMTLNPSPNPQTWNFTFFPGAISALRKRKVTRIALARHSEGASIDGYAHRKKFWFDLKYD